MKALTTILALSLLTAHAALAQVVDNASNYATWTNGSSGGTGFGTWALNNNDDSLNPTTPIFAGNFLGDSTAGAADINTGGNSFGLYANPGAAFSTATRSFSTSLTTNDIFTVDLGLNFANGNKGFNLRTAGTNVFGFNVGSGASINTSFSNNPVTATYDYGGAAALTLTMTMTSASSLNYSVTRTSPLGTQGTLFDGSITGITGSVDNFEFYVSGTDDGDAQNNLYFNNLTVVPEPTTWTLLGLGIGALIITRRLQRKIKS